MAILNGGLTNGKALYLSHVSSNMNMASEFWTLMDPSGILCDVELSIKTKLNGHRSTLEETRTNQVIFSAVTSTKYPLCCTILKRLRRTTTNRRNTVFLKIIVLLNF